MLTATELLAQPDHEYMSDAQQAFFRDLLVMKLSTVTNRMRESQESLHVERHSDVADIATVEESRTLGLNIAARDKEEVTRIKAALKVLAEGDYGYCLETGEEIGLKRLLAVPESVHSVETMRVIEARRQHQRGAA